LFGQTAIFGKVGLVAYEFIVIELIKTYSCIWTRSLYTQ